MIWTTKQIKKFKDRGRLSEDFMTIKTCKHCDCAGYDRVNKNLSTNPATDIAITRIKW